MTEEVHDEGRAGEVVHCDAQWVHGDDVHAGQGMTEDFHEGRAGEGVLQHFHVCILWLELIPSNKRNWVDCGGIAVHIVVHGVGVGGVGHCQASHTLHRTS